ncbi:MAG: FMN-binding negative transcriptional regulator [Chitinophagaceae bacterium]
MYIPKAFEFTNDADKIAFMKQYSFATIITNKDDIPIATQLPFMVDAGADKLILTAHFAKANEQASYIENNISLVIFSEPHAYISPVHYDKEESVPTWNYVAVHAYGKARIIEEDDHKLRLIEQMISFYEESYLQQWKSLPDRFRTGMLKGIVAFQIEVTDLQGKQKLSQNRTQAERDRIVQHLEQSSHSQEKDIADYMKKM